MARLTRQTLKLFGGSGAVTYFAQFGSQAIGSPVKTKDIASIQTLSAWVDGFQEALTMSKAPYLEDTNGLLYVHSYETVYILQEGIAEWDAGTTYFQNSIVKRSGTTELYGSLIDNNLGNPPPVSTSNANWKFLNPTPPAVPLVGNGLKAALVMAPNGGAPNTKVDVNADTLSVQGMAVAAVAVTADITASGANGLDTGAPANNTWYAVHIITNVSGSLVAALLSLSAGAPTLPGGYTNFRRVGWVRRNGAGNFVRFQMQGDWVYWTDAAPFTQSNPGAATNMQGFGVAPTSKIAALMVTDNGGSGGTAYAKPTGSNLPATPIHSFNTIAGNNPSITNHLQFPVNPTQQLDFSAAGSISFVVQTLGYYDPV